MWNKNSEDYRKKNTTCKIIELFNQYFFVKVYNTNATYLTLGLTVVCLPAAKFAFLVKLPPRGYDYKQAYC